MTITFSPRRALIGAVVAIVLVATISTVASIVLARPAQAAKNTDNDRILRGDRKEYIEVFKRDSAHGYKNYLYTITEFTDRWGRHCTVTTGASEKTIALDCDGSPR